MRKAIAQIIPIALLASVVGCNRSEPNSGDGGNSQLPASQIMVLSNRADLISGGNALVEVALPESVEPAAVRVDVDGRDVTSAFARRANGRYLGLVTDLSLGRNLVTARMPDGATLEVVITSHPIGGPVFAGPQVQPWICATEAHNLGPATDAQCNAPTQVSYQYKSSATGKFAAYDTENPPPDVATTTTDQDITVPYILRVETGTMDRGIYQILVLADPSRAWTPWAPQEAWNHKLMIPFGGACSARHTQTASAGAYASGMFDDTALSRGFAVAANGLNTLGNNCNEVVSAEALMMLKEHIRETLGPIRYTIGEGLSGGSVQQHNIAGNYPGLLDGLIPSFSFPDAWTTINEVIECGLLFRYFNQTSPHLWAVAAQRALVEGHANVGSSCVGWTATFLPALDPTGNGPFGLPAQPVVDCTLPAEQRYNAQTNPAGVRCTVQDYGIAVFGARPQDGFARRPLDNVGVQYGLDALNSGLITADQFVDLNAKVGGYDIDLNPQAQRTEADPGVLAIAYRSGRVTDARQLATVPIIDVRPQDNEEVHQSYYSYTTRARLDQANGTHANQVIWTVPTTSVPLGLSFRVDDPILAISFQAMDRWLARIEADTSDRPLAQKVIANKPPDAVDSCWIGDAQITDPNTCRSAFPYYSNPRIAAGGPFANNVLKCQLKPLDRGSYNVSFSDAQWAQLEAAFPSGVCDWTRLGVDQQPVIPWLTFADGPGGRPLEEF